MSFWGQEKSRHGGQPEELYLFSDGTNYWPYVSGQNAITFETRTYSPLPIKRQALEASQDLWRQGIEVTLPRSAEVAALFIAYAPESVVTLSIHRRHATDGVNEFATIWKGRVLSLALKGSEAVLKCEPASVSMNRAGLRARYQLQCRYALYSPGCQLVKESFSTPGTVFAISGATLTVNAALALASGYFNGGLVIGNAGTRLILTHAGALLTLTAPISRLATGHAVTLHPGCKHDLGDCTNKFNNLLNFGGFPWLPKKNPFTGDAVA